MANNQNTQQQKEQLKRELNEAMTKGQQSSPQGSQSQDPNQMPKQGFLGGIGTAMFAPFISLLVDKMFEIVETMMASQRSNIEKWVKEQINKK